MKTRQLMKTKQIYNQPLAQTLKQVAELNDLSAIGASDENIANWLLANDLLKHLPAEIVKIGIQIAFGNAKCSFKQTQTLNTFRQSHKAAHYYKHWQGASYKPIPCVLPKKFIKKGKILIHYIEL